MNDMAVSNSVFDSQGIFFFIIFQDNKIIYRSVDVSILPNHVNFCVM